MNIIVQICPRKDSDNTYPPYVNFEIRNDGVTMTLGDNDRSLTFDTDEISKLCDLIQRYSNNGS